MTRQTRNKRKKSPSVAIEDDGRTKQDPIVEVSDHATDDTLSGDSDFELIASEPKPRQTRGRRLTRGIMSDLEDEGERATQEPGNDYVARDKIGEETRNGVELDTGKDDGMSMAIDAAVVDADGQGTAVETHDPSEVIVPEPGNLEQGEGVDRASMASGIPKAPDAGSTRETSTDDVHPEAGTAVGNGEERLPPTEEVVHSVDDVRSNLEEGIRGLGNLEEVYTCSNTGGTTLATSLPSVDLRYEVNDITALRRIYVLATLKGNVRVHNLGLAKTQDYYFFEKEKYIRRKAPPGVAEFFLLGTVTLSKLLGGESDKNRQLCLRPMWELFGRSQAFIGAMLKKRGYYVSTFQGGVSFSSLFPQKSKENGRPYPNRSRYSNTVLPFTPSGVDVPIYDGTVTPFTLSTYGKLNRYREELQQNSVVMVTFTVGAYNLPIEKVPMDAMPGLDTRVSFNIKDVLLIAHSSVDFREKMPSGEEPWGVERPENLWQPEIQEQGTEVEPEV